MYLLSISDDYAEAYWFQCDQNVSPDFSLFREGRRINKLNGVPVFDNNNRLSVRKLLSFDYFHGDVYSFVGPKFATVIRNFASDIQLFPATVSVGGQAVEGCEIFNVVVTKPCIDMAKSDHEPMFSFLPEGPKNFFSIKSLGAECLGEHDIVLAEECRSKIFVSEKFKALCEVANLKGVKFIDCR